MKISYIHGPGNAYGTFLRWKDNREDTSIIKQTYSGQFYDLVREIDAVGQVICEDAPVDTSHTQFSFANVRRSSGSGFRYYWNELEYAFRVSRNIRQFQPDVIIISSDFPTLFLGVLPKKTLKILSLHNTFWKPYGKPAGLKEKIEYIIRRVSLKTADHAVCVSRECQRQYEENKASTCAFSKIQIPRLEERFQEHRGAEKILYVGRIEKNKGVEDLIRAFYKSRCDFPDIKLKYVGDGDALDGLRRLAVALELEEAVEFTGRLDAHGVGRSYAEADLCVCPTTWSFNEGLATVPLEAASYGIPTIMSQAVPAKEFFGERSIRFEPGNVDDLADKIRLMISNTDAYVNARNDACESFRRTMREEGDWKSGIRACLEHMFHKT